jgi:hypothetical protein
VVGHFAVRGEVETFALGFDGRRAGRRSGRRPCRGSPRRRRDQTMVISTALDLGQTCVPMS